jgi:AbrB family looped-hinge helix DNA binding protein
LLTFFRFRLQSDRLPGRRFFCKRCPIGGRQRIRPIGGRFQPLQRGRAMARRIIIDPEKLIQMVQNGTVQKEILEKFGLNTAGQLKVAYANALMEAGKAPAIQREKKAAAGRAKKPVQVKVGKKGSIAIPKKLIADLGMKAGDTFVVRPSKAGLSLKKIDPR